MFRHHALHHRLSVAVPYRPAGGVHSAQVVLQPHELRGETSGLVVRKVLPLPQAHAHRLATGYPLEIAGQLPEQFPGIARLVADAQQLQGGLGGHRRLPARGDVLAKDQAEDFVEPGGAQGHPDLPAVGAEHWELALGIAPGHLSGQLLQPGAGPFLCRARIDQARSAHLPFHGIAQQPGGRGIEVHAAAAAVEHQYGHRSALHVGAEPGLAVPASLLDARDAVGVSRIIR